MTKQKILMKRLTYITGQKSELGLVAEPELSEPTGVASIRTNVMRPHIVDLQCTWQFVNQVVPK